MTKAIEQVSEIDAIWLKCTNGHVWRFTGKRRYPFWCTCPKCFYKVRIPPESELVVCKKCGEVRAKAIKECPACGAR